MTVGKYNEGRTSERVHRLVAMLFVSNPDNLPEVNHIDFDRTNNCYTNLEWMTHQQNIQHTVSNGRHAMHIYDYTGKNNHNYGNDTLKLKYAANPELAKINNSRPGVKNGRCRPISLLDSNKDIIKTFEYIGQCAEYLINEKISTLKKESIRDVISKKTKSGEDYFGYYFELI